MLRKGMMQVVAFVLAAVLLTGAPATAGGLDGLTVTAGVEQPAGGGVLTRAWLWLQSLWAAAACGGDNGMCIDPDGVAACGGDNGMCIDPNG